ncbi:MAG: aminotransferase class V-fold PLP-dependent enzyme [Chloroflexi bacterium]|nr:aminotransferase class V-fold PLP-dependent enzyme [Chloroflexota bacterium]
MIYLDNAATSWPKPTDVVDAMARFLSEVGANPGRAGHRLAVESGRIVYRARERIAELFSAHDPLQVVFGQNVTEGLNLALRGLLRPGDHVVTSSMEHNSVMRPLRLLEQAGVSVTVVQCSSQGELDPGDVEAAIRSDTKMVVLNHASNVTGTILPIGQVGRVARDRGVLFLVDAAQTAGVCEIDMQADRIDLLAFTGHKSLYGPTGTGGLVVGERVDLTHFRPLKLGGTGSRSEYELQPEFLPDMFESGTPNVVGLAGLEAALQWLSYRGVESVRRHEVGLAQYLIDGLLEIPGVTGYGGLRADSQTATVSFNIDALAPSEVGLRLDEEYGIMCRVGLHCSPAAHRTIGTFPDGAVRFGMGVFNTQDQVDIALMAVRTLAKAER